MYCLSVIHKLNREARPLNTAFNRDCSFNKVRGGVILHSAIHRSTVFLAKEHGGHRLAGVLKRSSQATVNRIIESRFA